MPNEQRGLIASFRFLARKTKQELAESLQISRADLQDLELRETTGDISLVELATVATRLGYVFSYSFQPEGKSELGGMTRGLGDCNQARPASKRLRAQYRAIANRLEYRTPFELEIGHFNPPTGEVITGGRVVKLSPLEFAVFEELARAYPKPVRAEGLIRDVWGEDDPELINNLRVAISKVRRRFGRYTNIKIDFVDRAYRILVSGG